MPPLLVFKFVRHGETQENRQKVLCGHLDAQLNALGKRQAAAVGVSLRRTPFVYAFASDLSRAVETANAILEYHQIPLVTDNRLREKYWGDAEGVPYGTKVKNKGETIDQLRKRALEWWKETVTTIINEHAGQEQDSIYILVVSHGGLIRSLIKSLVYESRYRFANVSGEVTLPSTYNTGLTTVEATGVYKGRLVLYNDHSHLVDVHADEESTVEGVQGS